MDFQHLLLSNDVLGWSAALLTLMTFVCRDMRRLRLLALAANAAFIAYGALAHLLPVLALHLALIPVNLWRLNQTLRPTRCQDDADLPQTPRAPVRSHGGRPRGGWMPRRRRPGVTPRKVSTGPCEHPMTRPGLAFAEGQEARR